MKMIDARWLLLLSLAGCTAQDPAGNNDAQAPVVANVVSEATPPSAPSRESRFTKLTEANCRLVEENREEGPYWRRDCPGDAGWRLDWTESDLRQGLALVAPSGKITELPLAEKVTKGAFNSIGETIEWRGPAGGAPDVLVIRVNVSRNDEPQRPDISKLAVVRLGGTPCLTGVIDPGAGQSDRARALADKLDSACL